MRFQTPQPRGRGARDWSRREAIAALAMPIVFALWTAVFIMVSGWVAGARAGGGQVAYVRAWLPWLGLTALWALPLVAGVVLGVRAVRHGGGPLAWIGAVVNAAVLVLVVGPSLIDRLVNL